MIMKIIQTKLVAVAIKLNKDLLASNRVNRDGCNTSN